MRVAIVRGKYLNQYEMQSYEPLKNEFDLVGFASLKPLGDEFNFRVEKLPSPLDLPDFPFKMPLLNRVFSDGHFLLGLERKLAGFDIAHSAETYFGITRQCLWAKGAGLVKKVVVTIWENIPFANEGIWGRRRLKKEAILGADFFIACSQKARQALLKEGVENEKVKVVYPGIDLKKFSPARREKTNELIILFVGRLEKYKGVYEILKAIKLLLMDKKLKEKKMRFWFVGDGREKKKFFKLEKRLGIEKFIKHFTARYSKITEIYKKADIFWAPSWETEYWQEQFGMAILEAQAAGLPIITTDCGSIKENAGDEAFYVEQGDCFGLYKIAKKLILDKRLRLEKGRKARKRAESFFDCERTALAISSIYKRLIEK